jgi:hypothetical protein
MLGVAYIQCTSSACAAPLLLRATALHFATPALQELRWLVSTAWNRGAVHARFGRTAEAERYQRWAAGALQYHAPLEEQYQVPTGAASGHVSAECHCRVQAASECPIARVRAGILAHH